MNQNNSRNTAAKQRYNSVTFPANKRQNMSSRLNSVAERPLLGEGSLNFHREIKDQKDQSDILRQSLNTRSMNKTLFTSNKFNKIKTVKNSEPICDVVDHTQDEEDEDDNQELDEYDQIRTTVDPAEDHEFTDYDDELDREDGELVEEESQDNEGQVQINDDTDFSVDSEVTFKKPINHDLQSEAEDFSYLKGNVAFENYIKKMVAEQIQSTPKGNQGDASKRAVKGKRKREEGTGGTSTLTPKKVKKGNDNAILNSNELIKSPSDTTIYAPALNRLTSNVDHTKQIVDRILNDKGNGPNITAPGVVCMPDVTDQITHFIEGVRLEAKGKSSTSGKDGQRAGHIIQDAGPSTSCEVSNEPHIRIFADPHQEQIDAAKDKADKLILDAERFKATVNTPPGELPSQQAIFLNAPQPMHSVPNLNQIQNMSNVNQMPSTLEMDRHLALNDDDFFHVTCHVDTALRCKIERGEYVDLERLLPKQRNSFGFEDNRMNLIHKDGQVFVVPAGGSSNRISGIRKWEQAFRIYAAIYSQANPTRAAEIWQYVHTINVAASGYTWDNVSTYDVTFRHLMSQNPARSWSKIYSQMWSMTMRDVLPRNAGVSSYNSNNNHSQNGGRLSNNKRNSGSRKPRYCWAYNRGNACKDSADKCKFIHRCSYCDIADHNKETCTNAAANKKN